MPRLAIAVCCYAGIFTFSFLCALLLRFDLDPLQILERMLGVEAVMPIGLTTREAFEFEQKQYAVGVFLDGLALVVLLKVGIVLFSREWRRQLRYSTIHDMAWSAAVCCISGTLLAALQQAPETFPEIPRGVIFIDTVLSAATLAAARIAANSLRMLRHRFRNPEAVRTLIYANSNEAHALLTSLQAAGSSLRVVGLVSPKAGARAELVAGVPILDASAGIEKLLRRTAAQMILLPSSLPGKTIREISDVCRQQGVDAHVVPRVDDIPGGRFQLRMRDVTIDDLLRRDPNRLDLEGIRGTLEGRVVLVTGAAGSIGSEVCRQLLRFGPRRIVMLDQSEFAIFQLEQEFQQLRDAGEHGGTNMEFVIEDVTDEAAMLRVFMQHRPVVVFHAAAYKHVPLMECNPQAAVRNNVLGTRVVVDLADRFHVERFVMISTDKAVRPTNIMGATKLIAEEYLAAVAQRSRTRFITVRFGNVLNSAGSVVPTFRRQIEEGGPVTVTDPRMQRYFMTIPEAVQLVLQSGAIGEGGDVLILDMGEPVRIVELAKDMIRLSGQRYPEDIDIVFTGLRPGEKLYEELFYETEQHAVRVHEKIFRAPRGRLPAEGSSERDLAILKKHIYGSREELREVLWQITARIVDQSSAVEERSRRAA
ncbi:MAG: polysaccharide biosynthesis protein [Planctomycetaceae bacterium]